MPYILRGLHKNFASVQNQILTNSNVQSVENLIKRLLRVPSPIEPSDGATLATRDSLAFFTHFNNRDQRHERGDRGGHGTCP